MLNLKNFFNTEVLAAVSALQLETAEGLVSQSNRPDLSDYQSNVALPLAKKTGQNPRELAAKLAEVMAQNDGLYTVSVDGPGFINFKLSDKMLADNTAPFAFAPTGRTIVLDYGGPNIAKALHVGHLRAGVIGESVKRILRAYGDTVIGDVHFGDWGTPIGMLITELQTEGLPSDTQMNIDEISALYLRAAANFKESDDFKDKARVATAELQSGNEKYRKIWQMFHDVSVAAVKKIYDKLDVSFDYWYGESDVNDILPSMFADLCGRDIAIEDDGAVIIRLPAIGKRERAPFILRKTDGAFTYAATDLATIIQRIKDFKADAILYVVDARQGEHFEQLFEIARKSGYASEKIELKHLAFGTVNGKDGKPFKTREGGTMSLLDLITLSETKATENLPDPSSDVTAAELADQAQKVAIGALKYQDLKATRTSDYIFDTENFTRSEGKTGAYIQYAIVRINSILAKAAERGFAVADKVTIESPLERDLILTLERYPEVMDKAHAAYEPSEISSYVYLLAQKFSSLYAELSILNETDESKRASRLKLAELVRDMLKNCLYLLGIECPARMLKKEDKA